MFLSPPYLPDIFPPENNNASRRHTGNNDNRVNAKPLWVWRVHSGKGNALSCWKKVIDKRIDVPHSAVHIMGVWLIDLNHFVVPFPIPSGNIGINTCSLRL